MSSEAVQAVLLPFALALLIFMIWFAITEGRSARRGSSSQGAGGGIVRARMRRMSRPTLLLAPSHESGFSKLGGQPELPDDMVWPEGERSPRSFLAQVDLGVFQRHLNMDWLPPQGLVFAFHDPWRGGFADEVLILSSLEEAGPPKPFPEALAPKLRFKERRVGFEQYESLPSLDWLYSDESELDLGSDELEALADLPNAVFGDEIQHRIGGYPSEIQSGQMHVACEYIRRGLEQDGDEPVPDAIRRAARDWRMILQIDSDPGLGMNWGDGGRLYVFGRKQDLVKGDFSKTVTISQTH